MRAPLPPPFAELAEELENSGFVREKDEAYEESFGNRLVELRAESQGVRFVRDRSQWSVDVWVASEWQQPELVIAALDDREACDDALPEETEADLAGQVLSRLDEVNGDVGSFLQRYRAVAVRRSRRIFD